METDLAGSVRDDKTGCKVASVVHMTKGPISSKRKIRPDALGDGRPSPESIVHDGESYQTAKVFDRNKIIGEVGSVYDESWSLPGKLARKPIENSSPTRKLAARDGYEQFYWPLPPLQIRRK